MVGDLLLLVESLSVVEIDYAVAVSHSQEVLPAQIQTLYGRLHSLLDGDFAFVCIPLNQQLVLSACVELALVVGNAQSPQLFIEMSVHDHLGRCSLLNLDNFASSGAC